METVSIRPVFVDRNAPLPYDLEISLNVSDPEVIQELLKQDEGTIRNDYALCALKIGLLALKQARGQIDGELIQREGERLLKNLQTKLDLHASQLNNQLTGTLKDYFDPESGRFHERVQRLVKKDGELEDLLRRQIGLQDSELCRTLVAHVGASSPLMKLLSPKESEGLLKSLSDTLSEALTDQRRRVLEQFTLDQPESALSRLVKKLTDNHGDLNKNLQSKIDDVVKEFSLDKDDSALSRLVAKVTAAQKTISDEFSLDNETSALSRMSKQLKNTSDAIDNNLSLDKDTSALFRLKRELLDLLKEHSKRNQEFQEEIKQAVSEMQVRRKAALRSPEHGKEFELLVFDYIQTLGQRAGEVVEFTGNSVGLMKSCKIGDVTIEMSPDHFASGCKIVIEAKDKQGYTLTKARDELYEARQNRGASIGVFVFAKANAPAGLEPLQRIGDDLYVVWDSEDSTTDLYLNATLMVSRALCTRQSKQREAQAVDFTEIEKAILEIQKQSQSLEEIDDSAKSITKQVDKITNRIGIARRKLEKQVETLGEYIADLKESLADTSGTRFVQVASV